MSQFSPYMPLRIVPVITYSIIKIVINVKLIHIHEKGIKDTPNTVNVRYCTYSTCFILLHKGRKKTFYTKNLSFVTVLTKLSAI